MATELGPIGQIHLSVSDIGRALPFYRDVLRLPQVFDVPSQTMAFFQCGGTRLYVGEAEPGRDVSHPLLYFRVDDIDEAHRDLRHRGVVFEGSPHLVHEDESTQLWLALFRDPDGTLLALMEERALLVAEK
ncbi:MAG: VOC family protein [Actinobacteria bacterium]|nr:VOC family protein [Actinomycetota bacterium]